MSQSRLRKAFGNDLPQHKIAQIEEKDAGNLLQECYEKPERSARFASILRAKHASSTAKDTATQPTSELKQLMRGYRAIVDAPGCDVCTDLCTAFPDAKVILTVRDSDEQWWTSFSNTIGVQCTQRYAWLVYPVRFLRKQEELVAAIMMRWQSLPGVGGRMGPKVHSAHNQLMRETVPKERLLEYNVKMGWPKLCEFLEVPVPEEPFPNLFSEEDIERGSIDGRMCLVGLSRSGWRNALFLFAAAASPTKVVGLNRVLERCRDLLKIFQDPTNRVPLRQEIIAAHNEEKALWPANKATTDETAYHHRIIHIPFPFIATCLTLGAGLGPDGYDQGVSIEPFHMEFDQGDNDDGITVFDITDLQHVRYCFVHFEHKRQVQQMAPLSPRVYLGAYSNLDGLYIADLYTANRRAELKAKVMASLQQFSLIETATLQDTWPRGGWQQPEVDNPSNRDIDSTAIDHVIEKLGTSSLQMSAMDSFLRCVPNPSADDMALLAEAELLPGFHAALKAKLYHEASHLEASEDMSTLLSKALSKDVVADLSPFTTLTANHLATIIANLQQYSSMTSLNLSNRPDLTEADLLTILAADHICKTLILLSCPQICADFLVANLGRYDLFHHDLLRQPLKEDPGPFLHDPTYQPRKTWDFSPHNHLSHIIWFPIAKEDVQISYLHTPPKADSSNADRFMRLSTRSRKGAAYQPYPIHDIPVSAGKAVKGILRLLPWIWSSSPNGPRISDGIAWAFATAPCITATEDAIGMLSSLYSYPCRNYRDPHRELPSAPYPQLKTGQWALIIIHEAYDAYERSRVCEGEDPADVERENEETRRMKKMRYAMVTPITDPVSGQPRFRVVDIPAYIKEVLAGDKGDGKKEVEELTEYWNKRITNVPSEFYDKNDIHRFLDQVYPLEGGEASSPDVPPSKGSEDDGLAKALKSIGTPFLMRNNA
ncbi:MAG: hypothetical protein Q9220_006206 [cf. Caloplaca sp. 1 TL-2023]